MGSSIQRSIYNRKATQMAALCGHGIQARLRNDAHAYDMMKLAAPHTRIGRDRLHCPDGHATVRRSSVRFRSHRPSEAVYHASFAHIMILALALAFCALLLALASGPVRRWTAKARILSALPGPREHWLLDSLPVTSSAEHHLVMLRWTKELGGIYRIRIGHVHVSVTSCSCWGLARLRAI